MKSSFDKPTYHELYNSHIKNLREELRDITPARAVSDTYGTEIKYKTYKYGGTTIAPYAEVPANIYGVNISFEKKALLLDGHAIRHLAFSAALFEEIHHLYQLLSPVVLARYLHFEIFNAAVAKNDKELMKSVVRNIPKYDISLFEAQPLILHYIVLHDKVTAKDFTNDDSVAELAGDEQTLPFVDAIMNSYPHRRAWKSFERMYNYVLENLIHDVADATSITQHLFHRICLFNGTISLKEAEKKIHELLNDKNVWIVLKKTFEGDFQTADELLGVDRCKKLSRQIINECYQIVQNIDAPVKGSVERIGILKEIMDVNDWNMPLPYWNQIRQYLGVLITDTIEDRNKSGKVTYYTENDKAKISTGFFADCIIADQIIKGLKHIRCPFENSPQMKCLPIENGGCGHTKSWNDALCLGKN